MPRIVLHLFYGMIVLGLALPGCKRETEEVAETTEAPSETVAPQAETAKAPLKAVEPETGMTVPLEEVLVWETDGVVAREFLRGETIWCREDRAGGVQYPSLKFERPLFGSLNLSNADSPGGAYHFVLDKSLETNGDFDLLYWDANGDQDLTNDEPLKPIADPPAGVMQRYSGIKQQTCFAMIQVPCDFGPAGTRSVELLPRLMIRGQRHNVLALIPTKAWTGQFEVANQQYRAYLGYHYHFSGRLDQPGTALLLATEGGQPARWWGGDTLSATHWLGEKYHQFACSPVGDKLFVRPYDGPLGTFELGAGDREVTTLEMSGSLSGKETAVAVGKPSGGDPDPTKKCRIPVGDYYPAYLSITFGGCQVGVSNNYHTESGQRRSGPSVAGIKIREDKPFVLDFSNKPEVMFVHPAKESRVALGDKLRVEAVLIDPVLDIMLRSLSSAFGGGSLDPQVVIKRADGEVVAEGIMPFG